MRRYTAIILILILALGMVLPAQAMTKDEYVTKVLKELIVDYGYYGDEADPRLEALLTSLKKVSLDRGEKWGKILLYWKELNSTETVDFDDSDDPGVYCIVILGYQLNSDGTMQDELIGRLEAGLSFWQSHTDSYILCTGGGTASENKNVTEAGVMRDWMLKQGVPKDRIFAEGESMTTAQNAVLSYEIIRKRCPEVDGIIIASSDYHVKRGALVFEAKRILMGAAGESLPAVIGTVSAPTETISEERRVQAGSLMEILGESSAASQIYRETYPVPALSDIIETKEE